MTTLEDDMIDRDTDPGVEHLLRIARAQCDAALAFVAIRDDQGEITVVTYPPTGEGTYWTLDGLRSIAQNTWDDPLLGRGGRAVLRVSVPPKRMFPVPRQYSRLAVATLGNVVYPDLPWGLLCALEPASGQFTDEHLEVLGNLAVRLNNYLRVRQNVSDGVGVAERSEATGRVVSEPDVKKGSPPADEVGETKDREDLPETQTAHAAPRGEGEDQSEPSEQEIDVIVNNEVGTLKDGGDVMIDIPRQAPEEDAPAAPSAPVAGPPVTAGDSLVLIGLNEFLSKIDQEVSGLRQAGDLGAVLLLNIGGSITPIGELEAAAVSSRLIAHTRFEDSIARVGSGTFGVILKLRRGVTDPATIRLRLEDWARQSLPPGPGGHNVRSSLIVIDPNESPRAEDVFLRAVSQLGVL